MHIHGIQLVENIHYEEMVKTAPGIISDIWICYLLLSYHNNSLLGEISYLLPSNCLHLHRPTKTYYA
jgi:hypothetical protein